MSFPMYVLYSALLAAALVLGLPYWLVQALRHGKYRAGLTERFGFVPARIVGDQRPAIWVHAVSVGEVLAVSPLVERLRQEFAGHRVVVSTTTATGQKLARNRFGAENVFYAPLDFGFAVKAYMRALHPALVVVAETEFWPNFLRLTKATGARVAVVNARISDRSLPGYRRWRNSLRRVLANVDLFLAQSEEDGRRLVEIGAVRARVQVGGNLKFDAPPAVDVPVVQQLRQALRGAGPVLVCGSTMEGEEALLLRAFENIVAGQPRAVMVLAPRHPERFEKVAELLRAMHITHWRRSHWHGEPLGGGVLLLDSIGELAPVYALADLAFVGGSLTGHGGHNILEPAQFGVAVVTGVSYENFRDIVELFRANDAVRIVGPAELPLVLLDLANDETARRALGARAAATLRQHAGATERTLRALDALLPAEARTLP